MQLLDKAQSHEEIKALSIEEQVALCEELRECLLAQVSKTGGHLSSNLGVVELTVALHAIYDFTKDRLLFDVGHQSYVHKLLTGRKDRFDTLRQLDGLSGYPNPEESITDAFIAGHASTAISLAMGFSKARSLQGQDHSVVAVVGDGAMTGGLSYEGLCNLGASNEPAVIVLNDNGMSITENVGGLARYLARLRLRPAYNRFKRGYKAVTEKIPGGLYRISHRAKAGIKQALYRCSFFEDLGLYYVGPIDGHDLGALIHAIQWAKSLNKPVLLHITTTKGKGYVHSEEKPDSYHGVASFSPEEGLTETRGGDFSQAFGESLCALAAKEEKIVAISAAMGDATGLETFRQQYPQRFFDVGIAEGHATTMAGGMAKGGLIPVFAVYSSFLQRAYDMLLNDVALQKLHVVFAVDRAGLVGGDGETHQGIFDVGFLCQIPNMTIYSPASFAEQGQMLEHAVEVEKSPVVVRYPRGGQGAYQSSWDGAGATLLRHGHDITIVTYGVLINDAMEAAEALKAVGLSAQVIKLNKIKPLELSLVLEGASHTQRLLVVEEQVGPGGIGQQMLSRLSAQGTAPKQMALLNLGDQFIPHGDVAGLKNRYGIGGKSIAIKALEMCQ